MMDDWGSSVGNWGSSVGDWGSSVGDWGSMMSHDSGPHDWMSSSDMGDLVVDDWGSNGGPKDGWGVDDWGHGVMVDEGGGEDGVSWGVREGPDDGLTLATGEDVRLGVGDLGGLDLRGVDGADDGGTGGNGEGVAGYPVSIMISPVMGGEWDSLGGDVGEGSGNTTSSISHGSVGLSSLAVTPGSLSELILGVVLGLGGGRDNDGWSGVSNDLVVRGSSNHVGRVAEVVGGCPRVPGGDGPLRRGGGDDGEEDDGFHFCDDSLLTNTLVQ
jgi:hypothetical protein